jgi:dienelactone hydrolase
MKKKKILKYISVLAILISPIIVYAADEYTTDEYIVCGNNRKFPTIIGQLVSTIYVIIRIIVPILLVITGIISFMKATFSSKVEESIDKAKKSLVKNIISAAIIFFIVSILNFVIRLVAGTNNSFTSCINCMIHPNECKTTKSDVAQLCPGLLSEQKYYNENCEYIGPDKEKKDYSTGETGIADTPAASTGSTIGHTLRDNPNSTGSDKFKKYTYSGYSYYVYTPKQIDGDKAALIVYLHGRGGSGTTEAPLRKDGGGGFFHEVEKNNKEYPAYILILQVPSPSHFPAKTAMEIIKKIIEENNIDEKRVSIWGYSMGAEAMPAIVNANPNFFASAVFIAKADGSAQISGFKTVPTYGFYRLKDSTGAVTGTPKIVNRIKALGQEKAYIKEYPAPTKQKDGYTEGHAYMPKIVLEDTNIGNGHTTIIDWVLDQRRTD